MTALKVCGLRPDDDLAFVNDEMVSHIGIVFVPASKRYVAPRDARRMVEQVGDNAQVVGVFVDETFVNLMQYQSESGIDVFQLHGNESADLCYRIREAGFTVWKAISVSASDSPISLVHKMQPFLQVVDGILFDAAPPKSVVSGMPSVTGGHGAPFDWRNLSEVNEQLSADAPQIWVAGGLNAHNASELLENFTPYGIDVSSGVEVDGRKSPIRIYELLEAMKQHVKRHDLP